MSNPLTTVWERADVEEALFVGDEIAGRYDRRVEQLSRAGLLRPVANVRCVPCDACADHHIEEVTFIRSPPGSPVRAYIHCPEHGRVAVPLERLKQWTVDFEGLAKVIASALDLAGQVEDLIPERLWALGKTTIGGRSREVFLARGTMWLGAAGVFGACERLHTSTGALVLVPGEMPPQEAWTDGPPIVVPLKLVARLEEERLVFDRDHLEGRLTEVRRRDPIKAQESPGVDAETPEREYAKVLETKRVKQEEDGDAELDSGGSEPKAAEGARPVSDAVRERRDGILTLLPASDAKPLKNQGELRQLMTRKWMGLVVDRTTVVRDLKALREDGLIEVGFLRRTQAGDVRAGMG